MTDPSSRGKEIDFLLEKYDNISLRLTVLSEVMDDILLEGKNRGKFTIEERVQHKLMLRRLSGESNGNI